MAKSRDEKKVWILERHDSPLKVCEAKEGEDANPYMFTGPCADFDEQNDNDRLYSKEDYLEHVNTYLKDEINENALLGELDHNEDYMVSMKNISHMIKDLWFDEESGQVMIKIFLLDTRDGKDARAIADAGAPIYISSRASGYIDDAGNVTLEKIYTYDIVYRPGFKNAKLQPVAESISKKFTKKGRAVALYEFRGEGNDNNGSSTINKSNSDSDDMEKYATKEDLQSLQESLDKYTKGLGTTLDNFKASMLNQINEAKTLHLKSGKQNFKAINENGGLGGEENNQANSTAPDVNGNGGANEPKQDDDDSLEKNQAQNAEFKAKMEELEGMVNSLADEKEGLLDYIQSMTDRVNGQGDYMNTVSAFCNKLADMMDGITDKVNGVTDYSETIAERVNDITDFADMTATRVNQIHEYSEKIAENQNKLRDFSAKGIKNLSESLKKVNAGGSDRMKKVLENKLKNTESKLILESGAITKHTDSILESVKKKGIDRNAIILETKYPFVKHLNEETRSLFESIDPIKKKRVESILKNERTLTNERVSDVVNQVNEDNDAYRLLRNIPQKYVPVWEGLNHKMQNQVIALSKTRDLNNDYEMELFWESLDFGDVAQNINESHQPEEISSLHNDVVDGLGYDDSDVDSSLGIN